LECQPGEAGSRHVIPEAMGAIVNHHSIIAANRASLLASLVLPALAFAAHAQEPTVLERITIEGGEAQQTGGRKGETIARSASVATKTGAPVLETPRSVSVVTEQRMDDQGVQTVQDALLYSPGVYGATYGFDTRGDWSLIRGVPPEQYENGLKSLFGFYNTTRPHPYTLQRVEIVKGPASVLYGRGSTGGIVNLVSKLPEEETSREAYLEYGSFDRKEIGVDMTGAADENGEFLYRFIAVGRDSDTQVDYVDDNSYVLAPSFTWRPTDDTRLTLLAHLQRDESGTSTQFLPWAGTVFPAPFGRIPTSVFLSEPGWDRYDTEQASITAIFDHRFDEVWSMDARIRYSSGKVDYDSMYPVFPPTINPDGRTIDRVAYMSDASSQVLVGDMRFNADFATGQIAHDLAFGLDHQDATTENDYAYGSAGTIDLYDPVYGNIPVGLPYYDFEPANVRQTGFYAQDQLEIGGWITSLGLRYDIARDADGKTDRALSKDVGLMYRFGNGISPYVSYSESFLPVGGRDFYGDAFEPVRGKQYEAGVKYQPPGTPSIVTASVFHITQENLLTNDPANPLNQVQLGEAEIRGFEFEAQTAWRQFELLASYTYLDTESKTGSRIASVPDHMASAWLTWRPGGDWEGFKAGVGARYVGESWDGTDTVRTPSYVLADAMIGYETDSWGVSLVGRNLFDKVHVTTCLARGDCFYGQRRSVALRLNAKF
jgi:iron complex outermembrane receptor protein